MTELQGLAIQRTYRRIEATRHCIMVASAAGNSEAVKRHAETLRAERRTLQLQRQSAKRIH